MAVEDQLAELRAELAAVTQKRGLVMAEVSRMVREANAEFDDAAYELHRRIRALEPFERPLFAPEPVKQQVRRHRTTIADVDPEWSAEDRAHYNALRAKVRK